MLILAAANEPDLGLLVVNTLTKVKMFRMLSQAFPVYTSFMFIVCHRLISLKSNRIFLFPQDIADPNPAVRSTAVTAICRYSDQL